MVRDTSIGRLDGMKSRFAKRASNVSRIRISELYVGELKVLVTYAYASLAMCASSPADV